MKHEIQTAYKNAAPDRASAVRIYERVLNRAEAEAKPRRSYSLLRRLAVAAAIIAALALLATGGYAAYQHWRLPEPEPYTPGDGGIYQEHDRNEYTVANTEIALLTEPSAGSPADSDSPEPVGTEPISDEVFIQKGLAILNQVGMLDVRPEQLTVVRQENLYWGREEVEIRFDQGEIRTSVKLSAGTGRLLGLSGIDWQLEGSTACATDAEAEALARRYYEALPVEQGYVMTHVEKYDAQYWSYDFSREVEPGVYNQYEMVRVAVNPVSGRLTGCTVFCVPLLDDHEPGQERITQEQAEQIARDCPSLDLEGMTLTKAEVAIALPNWNYTEYQDNPNHRASDVTRWAWVLVYEKENSEFTEQVRVYVDCWTGEILGGDATK